MLLHERVVPVCPVMYLFIGHDLAYSVEAVCERNFSSIVGGEALDR